MDTSLEDVLLSRRRGKKESLYRALKRVETVANL